METIASELKWNEVQDALGNLPLTWVTIGDYIVIINDKPDMMIGGEPYIALQLWLDVKYGKIICRVWGKTISSRKVASAAELSFACLAHFKGRPCLGYPLDDEQETEQDCLLSYSPIPRKVSATCDKFLIQGTDSTVSSCPECLKLKQSAPEAVISDINTFSDDDNATTAILDVENAFLEEKMFKGEEDEPCQLETNETEDSAYTTVSHTIKKSEKSDSSYQLLLKCESCAKTFENRQKYEIHKAHHGGDPLYKACELCKKVIQCNEFQDHMKNRHKKNETFYVECHWCDKKLSTNSYECHAMRKHFYGKFICHKCPFSAYSANVLASHIQEGHEDCKLARCPSCKTDIFLTALESHYKSCIVTKIKLEDKLNQMCDKCGKTFHSKKHFYDHKKFHLREEGDESLYKHCDKCDKKFVLSHSLKEHMQVFHDNIKFICELCPMTFNSNNGLKYHINQFHSADQRYECKVCGVRKGSISHLRVHEKIHSESFQCSFCPKKLKSQQTLEAHERHHTGEKSFKCSMCSAAFTSSKSLRAHLRGVHKIAGPRGGITGWKSYKKKK